MFWLLCREYLYLKGELSRDQEWDVMVDLFMYRDPDAKKDKAIGDEGEGDEEEEADKEGEVVKDSMKRFEGEEGEEEVEEGGAEEEDEETWANPAPKSYA